VTKSFKRKWQRHDTFRGEIVSDAPLNFGRVPEGSYRIVSFRSGMRNSGTVFKVWLNGVKIATCGKQEQAKFLVALLDAGVPIEKMVYSEGGGTNGIFYDAWWLFKIHGKSVEEIATNLIGSTA
jgi:hypothetical protein